MIQSFRKTICAIEDRLTIRQQIGLAMAVLCIAIVSTVSFGAFELASQHARQLIGQEMVRMAEALSDRLDRTMEARFIQVKAWASVEPVRKNLHDPLKLSAFLLYLKKNYPDFEWIGVATPDGILRGDTEDLAGISVVSQRWFANGLQKPSAADNEDS